MRLIARVTFQKRKTRVEIVTNLTYFSFGDTAVLYTFELS